MTISAEPLMVTPNTLESDCPGCGSKVLTHASYCGHCGDAISLFDPGPAPHTRPRKTADEPVWPWVSSVLKLWGFLLLVIGIYGLIGGHFKITTPFFDLAAQLVSAMAIIAACLSSRDQLRSLFTNWQYFRLRSVFELCGVLLAMYVFMSLYIRITSMAGIETVALLADYQTHNWPLWAIFVSISLLPGIFEELAFRGYIQHRLENIGTVKEALVIQAAMFSVLHLLPTSFISHFFLGLALGLVRIRSRSIYPCILLHTTWNTIVILEEYYAIALFF